MSKLPLSLRAASIVAVASCFLLAATPPAFADTPRGTAAYTYMNFNDNSTGPSASQRSQYVALLNSIRRAAAHSFRGTSLISQSGVPGLIRIVLHRNGTNQSVSFWMRPTNLYVEGFTTTLGGGSTPVTWYFPGSNLIEQLNEDGQHWATSGVTLHLPFSVTYSDIERFGNISRANQTLSYSEFNRHFTTLYNASSNGSGYTTAAPMLFFIQYLAEGARFWDVQGVFSDVMAGSTRTMPIIQRELENDWSGISQYGRAITNNSGTSPHYTGPHVGTFYSWGQVAARLAVVQGY
ncbi:hypothetical protein KZ820_18725 [Sphingomonas sp. RRHST34]|uniref:Uncharacterized protein n=1 Tax=Sphingomonas citri TaxID=2862499 RepID=A0ABS7BT49_9SPHN|nr:ribosome-inactivating family protein [Sphingomonas citri]MBW6532783.1 hypothetical protein [Sphingomonas citri]